jgi:hypothetical protein
MPVEGGCHILSGSGDQFISTSFDPDLVLLFFSNHGTEGTVQALGGVIGMGTVNRTLPTEPPFPFPGSASAHALWYNNLVASGYLWDVAVWGRATNGVDGYALYGIDIGSGGFTLRYSGGFDGGGGNPIYWIAFGAEDDFIVHRGFHFSGKPEEPTPYLPTVGFAVGSGGTGPIPTDGSSVSFTNWAVSTWGMWAADEGIASPPTSWPNRTLQSLVGFNANAGNNTFFVGEDFDNNQLYAEAQTFGSGMPFGMFSHYRTLTDYGALEGWPGLGFDGDSGRLSIVSMSKLIGVTGTFIPGENNGDEVEIPIPFDVQAVVFMTRLENEYTGIPVHFTDGIANGFCTINDFQAVIATCGRAFDAPAQARYQNQGLAWVSSLQADAAGLHAGSAEITPNGFKLTTAVDTRSARPVSFMALGFPEEGPGFFRVVHR